MKIKILIIVVLLPICLFSQTTDKLIANAVCVNLSKLNLSEDIQKLNQKAVSAILSEYKNYQPKVIELIKDYEEEFKISKVEASKLIGQKMTMHLMHKCVAYQRITMFNGQYVPVISATTRNIGEAFTKQLLNRSKKTRINSKLIDALIVEVTEQNANLITKQFGDKYSKRFIKEFNAYLMTESIPYIKWIASNL